MSISETQIDRPRTRGHRGRGHAAQRDDKMELMRIMTPESPRADGRIVAHGAGRLGLIAEWRAGDQSDDDIGAAGVRPDPTRPDYHTREKAALGDLKCPECCKPITTPDLDVIRDTSRHLGITLPTNRHLNCTLARAKVHRNLAKRGDLVCVKCHQPISVAELDRMQFVGRRLGRALVTDLHVKCQVPQS